MMHDEEGLIDASDQSSEKFDYWIRYFKLPRADIDFRDIVPTGWGDLHKAVVPSKQ